MHPFRRPQGGSPPAALPALLRAAHLFGLALGSAFGRLRESGATAARMFERAEESALNLRMTREAAGILAARWDKVPERQRPHYGPEQRFRVPRAGAGEAPESRLDGGSHGCEWVVLSRNVQGCGCLRLFSRIPLSARVFRKEPSAASCGGPKVDRRVPPTHPLVRAGGSSRG